MRPAIKVGLSTASVYPEKTEAAFEYAANLGYDGVELMVWGESVSQDIGAVAKLSRRYRMPVLSVHAPCLLISQRVWGANPIPKLDRSVRAAEKLGAQTVVVHPPFRWQRRYGDAFGDLVDELETTSGIEIAVENMFKVRPPGGSRNSRVSAFRPSIDPTEVGFRHYTLDLSHTAAARMDALALAERMGEGLSHVHLADGTGVPKDEHLVPGRGGQPCSDLLEKLVSNGFAGQIVLEVNTRHASTPAQRVRDLAEALLFARFHLGQ